MMKGYFLTAIRKKTKFPPLQLLFAILLKVLTRRISQEREIKGIQIGREEMKLFIAGGITLYLETSKETSKKKELINYF